MHQKVRPSARLGRSQSEAPPEAALELVIGVVRGAPEHPLPPVYVELHYWEAEPSNLLYLHEGLPGAGVERHTPGGAYVEGYPPLLSRTEQPVAHARARRIPLTHLGALVVAVISVFEEDAVGVSTPRHGMGDAADARRGDARVGDNGAMVLRAEFGPLLIQRLLCPGIPHHCARRLGGLWVSKEGKRRREYSQGDQAEG